MLPMTEVENLTTGKKQTFSLTAKNAVIAAYAQSLGDYNTWDYKRYENSVSYSNLVVACGDFVAWRDDLTPEDYQKALRDITE